MSKAPAARLLADGGGALSAPHPAQERPIVPIPSAASSRRRPRYTASGVIALAWMSGERRISMASSSAPGIW